MNRKNLPAFLFLLTAAWSPTFAEEQATITEGPLGTVKKEIYVENKEPNKAPWVWTYTGEPGYREEIHTTWSHEDQVRGYGDSPTKPFRRVSRDDGRTWSESTPLPPILTFGEKISIIDWKFCGIYDPASKRHVDLSIHHLRDMREGPPRRIYNHALIRLSEDGGKTFGEPEMLRYEDGKDFSAETLLDPEFLKKNTGYPGQSIFRHSNGSLIIPVTNTNIPAAAAKEDEPVGNTVWPEKGGIGGLCYVGRWNENTESYDWKAGESAWLPRDLAFNGLLEADVAELSDGRVLCVWRVTKNGKESPAYKYYAVSEDGGLTFTKPEVFKYSDGSEFFSTSTFHRLFHSKKTGKLYWIGNIIPEHTDIPGHPRYPLHVAEVDEKTLGLIKDTVTEIDTRQEGEGERLQLSNFWINESVDEKNLEIYLTRLNEHPEELYTAHVYRYTVSFK